MKSQELVNRIMNSDFCLSNLPIQLQAGIPYITDICDRLYVSLYPHTVIMGGESFKVYSKRFEIVMEYPSLKIVKFESLYYNSTKNPTCIKEYTLNEYTSRVLLGVKRAYAAADELLEFYSDYGMVTGVVTEKYRHAFLEAVKRTGLEELYGVSV